MRHIAISIVAAVAWTDAAVVSARAETINVYDDHGGSVAEYDARWSELAARGANVRVVGPCQSACTVLLAHIPNERICVTPQASFGFHLAHRPDATATLWAGYNAGIREWIKCARRIDGGLQMDARARHLSLFSQVLVGVKRKDGLHSERSSGHDCPRSSSCGYTFTRLPSQRAAGM
jgi:hypothetical protein